jgi:hypothetical protein
VSVECLRVFSELRKLEIEGCGQISMSGFVVLQTACANLELDVGGFLHGHGRFEEELAYYQEKLTTALQAGECESERERARERERERGRDKERARGGGSEIGQQNW